MLRKIISLAISVIFTFQTGGFAQAAQLNLAGYLGQGQGLVAGERFRPASLRYFSYDSANNSYQILLDKGDEFSSQTPKLKEATQELLRYFLIGLSLPNDTFWVNLRPDAPDNIIDPLLEKTEIGKIFLEADLQLKKDTSSLTSPQNKEGKEYWDKLYKKAGELFGTENITIPTITRPWIVPNEVIVRESDNSAYLYKATLKVMLEEDYLKAPGHQDTSHQYNFTDPRLKELNEYSTQLLREKIIPRLTKEVNSSKRYAKLRQVYYSLVLSRWFKQRYRLQSAVPSPRLVENNYISLIDSKNLTGLGSKENWDKDAYFSQYRDSFAKGEYNLQENIATPYGQSIRSYVSGGIGLSASPIMGGSFIRKGKDFLQEYIAKLNSVMDTFMGDMDDTGVVRRHELRGDKKITGIDVYIAFGDIFSNDKAVTAENLDKLIEVFSKADATLVFEGKKDFLISIALILARFKKKGEYDPKEIRKELRDKLEDLAMVYGNEMRGLINQDTLKRFFNNNENPNFKKQLTKLLDENKVIQAAEFISREREYLYNTNTVAARDLLNVEDNVLRIRDILNVEKPIHVASPLTLDKAKKVVLGLIKLPKEGPERERVEEIIKKISSCQTMEDLKDRLSDTLIPLVDSEEKKLIEIGSKVKSLEGRKDVLEGMKLLALIRKGLASIVIDNESVETAMKDTIQRLNMQGKELKKMGIPTFTEDLALDIFTELLENAGSASPLTPEQLQNELREMLKGLKKTNRIISDLSSHRNGYNSEMQPISMPLSQIMGAVNKKIISLEREGISGKDILLYVDSLRNELNAIVPKANALKPNNPNNGPNIIKKMLDLSEGLADASGKAEELYNKLNNPSESVGSPVLGKPLLVNGKEIARYILLADLKGAQGNKVLGLVREKVFPVLTIKGSEILGIGANGREILGRLVDEGILREIPSAEGFLKVNKNPIYFGKVRDTIKNDEDFKKFH